MIFFPFLKKETEIWGIGDNTVKQNTNYKQIAVCKYDFLNFTGKWSNRDESDENQRKTFCKKKKERKKEKEEYQENTSRETKRNNIVTTDLKSKGR